MPQAQRIADFMMRQCEITDARHQARFNKEAPKVEEMSFLGYQNDTFFQSLYGLARRHGLRLQKKKETRGYLFRETDLPALLLFKWTLVAHWKGIYTGLSGKKGPLEPGLVAPDFYAPIVDLKTYKKMADDPLLRKPQYKLPIEGNFEIPRRLRTFFRPPRKVANFDPDASDADRLVTENRKGKKGYWHLYDFKGKKPVLLMFAGFG